LLLEETTATNERLLRLFACVGLCQSFSHTGDAAAAAEMVEATHHLSASMGGYNEDATIGVSAIAAVFVGDFEATRAAVEASLKCTVPQRFVYMRSSLPMPEALLGCGDIVGARRWVDENLTLVPGWFRSHALTTRAFIAMSQGEPEQAADDAHEALAIAQELYGFLRVPDALDCLARLSADVGNHLFAARLFGASAAARQRIGVVRIPGLSDGHHEAVESTLDALKQREFDAAWAEGAALSTEEAIAYAQRGRGERRRPSSGWDSLTPTERNVLSLVAEGLGNKDVAERLFISPRTVQTHLTHVYAKLGLESRIHLVQEAARHT